MFQKISVFFKDNLALDMNLIGASYNTFKQMRF